MAAPALREEPPRGLVASLGLPHIVTLSIRTTMATMAAVGATPAFGQAYEVHAAVVRGVVTDVVTSGLVVGGGVLLGRRLGVEADLGFLGDDVDGGSPLLGVGSTVRLTRGPRAVPFVSGGLTRLGDLVDLYAGGGVRIALPARAAVRVELRRSFPAADYRGCVPACSSPSRAFATLHLGVSVGPGS